MVRARTAGYRGAWLKLQEGAMSEIFVGVCLLIAVICVLGRAITGCFKAERSRDRAASRVDPISTYVDENYGSHFADDPISANHILRRL